MGPARSVLPAPSCVPSRGAPAPAAPTARRSAGSCRCPARAPASPAARSCAVPPRPCPPPPQWTRPRAPDAQPAALALAVARGLTEQLGHHQVDLAALRDAVAVPAVGRRDVVVVAQRRAGADAAGLLADVSVGRAADLPLLKEVDHLQLEV